MSTHSEPTSAWRLCGEHAQLLRPNVRAAVDLAQPGVGVHAIALSDISLTGWSLLGMDAPGLIASAAQSLIEAYTRGADLVAVYGPSTPWPVRVDALWRVLEPASSEAESLFLAGVELVVSVRTEALDSRPELAVQGSVPTDQVRRLVDPDVGRFERCAPASGASRLLTPDGGPGCLLCSTASPELSYVEMVHPADFRQSRLSAGADGGPVSIRHRLFAEPLEKGVILRARVRGLFVHRDGDSRRAAECYAAFAAADPPLGS
jgi:hypothetical protein